MQLDEIHLHMLEILRWDARVSVTALAEEVGVSRANAYARLAALEEAKAITGFHAEVDPAAVGRSVAALVFVSLWQNQWRDFRARLYQLPELEYFAVTTGQFDAMLLVRSDGVGGIHALVVDELAQWPSVKATETVFLMDEERFTYSLRPSQRAISAAADTGATRFVGAPINRRKAGR